MARVDLDEVLRHVDMNAIVDRIDVNEVAERIDMDELVEHTDLGAIIARSSGGMATEALDAAAPRRSAWKGHRPVGAARSWRRHPGPAAPARRAHRASRGGRP